MTRISATPRTGSFAGREVFTNGEYRGIFTRRSDGSHQQHTGTMQTPQFRNAAHLLRWLRANYPDDFQAAKSSND